MSAPTFAHFNALTNQNSGTSAHFGTGQNSGQLAIAFCQVGGTGSGTVTFSVSSAAYTIGETINFGGDAGSVCWAYRVLNGTNTDDPTFNWGGASLSWHGQAIQFAGQAASSFIGATNSASGNGTTITAASLSVNAASLVYALLFTMSDSQVIALPTSYTNISQDNDIRGSDRLCYETPAGSTSDAISESISSANWASFAIQIRSVAPGIPNYAARFTMPVGGL